MTLSGLHRVSDSFYERDWSSLWVAFHQCWADKGDLFSVVFVFVCVQFQCVCTCTPAVLKRCTREKSLSGYYPGCVGILWSQRWWVLYVLVSSEHSACLLHAIYTHTLSAVPAGRHLTVETTQIRLCLWVSVSLNQVSPCETPSSWKTLIINRN